MSRAEQPQTQEPTPTPTVVMVPDPSDMLSPTAFPLIDIQSEAWSLFFARITPSNAPHPSNSDIRKLGSSIQIFHSVPLGNGGYGADISAGQELKGADGLGRWGFATPKRAVVEVAWAALCVETCCEIHLRFALLLVGLC